jgi:hypothetical protein
VTNLPINSFCLRLNSSASTSAPLGFGGGAGGDFFPATFLESNYKNYKKCQYIFIFINLKNYYYQKFI